MTSMLNSMLLITCPYTTILVGYPAKRSAPGNFEDETISQKRRDQRHVLKITEVKAQGTFQL